MTGSRVRPSEWIAMMRLGLFFAVCGTLLCGCAAADTGRSVSTCPVESATDSILPFRDRYCSSHGPSDPPSFAGVTEGDETSLLKVLNMVYKNSRDHVAVLFYASWCPFSRAFRPSFSVLSSSYPTIPHFAIEESSVRPSILSKYGVHGFPTLFLLNSTVRVRYRGNRTLDSLHAFYHDITGMESASGEKISVTQVGHQLDHDKLDTVEQESCPFEWARSPEKLFKEETYLALATAFVLLRLLYFAFPTLLCFAQFTWRRHIQNVRLVSLLEHPRVSFNRMVQLFNSLKEPCKKRNLQEGAMNARAWASKSLATVSLGDASTSRSAVVTECH
ncbi:hypothetical protein Tsubulata_022964 [Turnera subulata]|uniref:Thioredoxin domain-containing protein n=1 Tax=Turnera subulata TaxID=218843 RepID=A0A9Q0JFQ9_9ROSI|nr:hypothetical protein Tsubulata_022964 [Turnera subulata]